MVYVEIGLVVLLTVLNGLLAMSELAVVSARPARLQVMEKQGSAGARQALKLASDPGAFLSTVQIGITLVGVLSGAFSGATLGERLSVWLAGAGMPPFWADVVGVTLVVTLVTYLSLIIGELVPKRLALRNPERIAAAVAPFMMLLSRVAWPLVFLLDHSGRLVLALLGQGAETEQNVTEEEIRTLVAEAETSGVLEPGEGQMISRVMRLGDSSVRLVMTPRVEVDMIDLTDTVAHNMKRIRESPHSRLPAHDGDPDEPLGIVWVKDLVGRKVTRQAELRALVRQAPIIPAPADALDVIDTLRQSTVHIGLVHDEYGHFLGVVTTADLLEAIVGVFADEEGPPEEAIVQRADGSRLISGWMPATALAEALSMHLPKSRKYETAAGMLIEAFGRLPEPGDQVNIGHWHFEVVDLDGRRIDKIIATPRAGKRGRTASPVIREEK
ncbi:MAG: hemolysin family protein [Nitratireductor sp.]|nr:hemolysin family protein [Nitratireductor sp.]